MHDLLTFDLIQRNESRLNIKSYIDKGVFLILATIQNNNNNNCFTSRVAFASRL